MTTAAEFTQPLVGNLTLDSGETIVITATRWHWKTLGWLAKDVGIPVAAEFSQVLARHPGASADELFASYVEAHLESVDEPEA